MPLHSVAHDYKAIKTEITNSYTEVKFLETKLKQYSESTWSNKLQFQIQLEEKSHNGL